MNIEEIAKMAGVSKAAVSRYFNQGYVSEEKREAIRNVVEQTGYRPCAQAQTLRTKKTRMIGVILPKIDSASMGSVVAGILAVLNEKGYQLLLADTQNNPRKELEYLKVFDDRQVDGVILAATVFTSVHKKLLKNMKVPLVIVGQRLSGFHCVYHDDYHSIYDMTALLLEKGRKNLAYIGVLQQDKAVGEERYRGFCDAVRERGCEWLKEQMVISGFSIEDGCQAMEELWRTWKNLDGVVCATDEIAIGAMQYLKSIHVEIPGKMMVAGHGDSILTRVTTPTLTTVHFSYEESGTEVARMLLRLLDKEESAVREIKLGYHIVQQQTTMGAKRGT